MSQCKTCGGTGVVADASEMRQLRIKRGLSLRDVAAQMDISAPYLSDLERGQRQWNEHRRAKFLEVLK